MSDKRRAKTSRECTIEANCGEIAALVREGVFAGDYGKVLGKQLVVYQGLMEDGNVFKILMDWPLTGDDWEKLL